MRHPNNLINKIYQLINVWLILDCTIENCTLSVHEVFKKMTQKYEL